MTGPKIYFTVMLIGAVVGFSLLGVDALPDFIKVQTAILGVTGVIGVLLGFKFYDIKDK